MNRTRLIAAVAIGAAVAVATGCGDMMYVEVEMPEVCNTVTDAGFQGLDPALLAAAADAGIELDAGVQTLSYALDFPLTNALPESAMVQADGEISLLSITINAEKGIPDFSFLQRASIDVSPPSGSALAARSLLAYTQTPETVNDTSIVLKGERFNLLEYMKEGALNLSISLTGRLPLNQWSTNIRACGYVRGKYNYLQ